MAVKSDQQAGPDGESGSATCGATLDRTLAGVAFLLVGYVAVSALLGAQVEASVSIGKVVNVTGGGGLAVKLLVQTESGFYPLKTSVVIESGTPLILEKRLNGDVYVCGPNRGCVQTAQSAWTPPHAAGSR